MLNISTKNEVNPNYTVYSSNQGGGSSESVQIDDNSTSTEAVWSSSKVNNDLTSHTSNSTIHFEIDDNSTATNSVWSSSKVSTEISAGSSNPATTFHSFQKSTNNSSSGFFVDSYVQIGWDGYDEIMIQQPSARSSVYATGLSTYGGSYPSGQHMLLSTVSNDFYQNSGIGQIDFTISSDSDNTHPFYHVRFHISTSSGLDYCYCIVDKFT